MSDLISREVLYEATKDTTDVSYMAAMILCAPAVDAVEVVRCCDCIHHRVPVKDECGAIQFLYCYHPLQEEGELMLRVDFTDYCSYGERRESEASK